MDDTTSLPLFPESASTFADQWEILFWYISAVIGVGGLIVFGLLIYFSIRYRKSITADKTPRILGSHRLELFWTIVPLILFLTFFVWGVILYNDAMKPPKDAPEIHIVGKQWMWKVQYEKSGIREINELHLLVGQPVQVHVTSEDVIHDVGIPAFRQKIDAVPGRTMTTWYHPTKAGVYHWFCDQYCGKDHSKMIGKVYVLEREDYEAWLAGESKDRDNAVDGSLAWQGRQLFLKLQCLGCHSADSLARAPVLEDLYGKTIPVKEGGRRTNATVNREYIYESTLYPDKKVAEGWESIMPSFKGRLATKLGEVELSEEEVLIRLNAYIRGLHAGQTPARTEQFAPPVGAPVTPPSEGEQPMGDKE